MNADRYEAFAREYVIDLNATRAALAAGYSERTAGVKGSQLLKTVKCRQLIDKFLLKRAIKTELKAKRVIEELQRIAFANPQDYMRINADGQPDVDLSKLTAIRRRRFPNSRLIRLAVAVMASGDWYCAQRLSSQIS